MKKHVIAAAVAAAVSVPALAQNVSISGVVDVGMASIDTGAAVSGSRFSGTANGLSTSNIQFQGSDDLGGGVKADFILRQEFAPNTGLKSGHPANNALAANTGNRDTFQEVSVGMTGEFGSLRVGKFNHLAREANGIGRLSGNLGRIDATRHRNIQDLDNTIAYTTPTVLGGFTGQYAFSGKETGADPAAAAAGGALQNFRTQSLYGGYAMGPLRAGVGYTIQNITAAAERKQLHVGADYDFGVARVGLIYAMNEPNSTAADDRQAVQSYSIVVPLGNGLNLHANYANYSSDVATSDASGYAVGLTKDLSKRTTIYASYGRTTNEATATVAHGGSGAAPAAGDDPRVMGAGVRHTF